MPPEKKSDGDVGRDPLVPDWVKPEVFEDLLKKQVPNFKKTKALRAKAALSAGENYATVMLRVELDVETKDNSVQTRAFMLKAPHQSEAYRQILEERDIFEIERGMYLEVVPEMEQMYRNVGVEVKFGAEAYEIPASDYYVLLEDLRPRGFRNADRLKGLDQSHTESVLRKLAQWHAASAVRVDTKGPYNEKYTAGFFKNKHFTDVFLNGSVKTLLQHVHNYEGHEAYIKDLKKVSDKVIEIMDNLNDPKPDEFNALNHGDGWSNNIMFQYNGKNELANTYFVDLQVPKWGTVAQDLYYFLISSTSLDVKLSKFDYFIWFYHSELVKHLTLLNYSKPLPTLRSIHEALNKYSGWAFICSASILGFVLLDPTDDASFENVMAEDANFKKSIFTNPRYKKHMEALLPWLKHRGALE
ncbi:uncharacterized protein [Drosophila bipectinata]|uniref:uncharacterized protein n=1 Tax=Drosophila bipectinata TaxID=42026 RepID=UPI001C89F7B0|nr:uncharacterized protein LOC108130262 [Drosophila bipectinata]